MRFKKYSNDWIKYKITDLGEMRRGKSKHRPRDDEMLYGGVYPFIQTGDIKKAYLYINEYEKTYSNYGLSQSKLWKKGTLCITIAANIAETAILSMDACFPDSVIGWCSNNQLTNNLFIKYYFDYYKEQLKRLSVGGAQENLNLDKLEKIYFNIPSLQEQNNISNFLSKIDERIQTQIKIINDYISYRNAIVDHFFQSSSSEWKRVKLSNILEEYTELHIKDNSIVHATLSKDGIFPKTDRYDRDFLVKNDDKKYKVTHLNDICYNPSNLKFGVITRNTYGDCIISPIYVTFKIKNNYLPEFIELLVARKHFISKARKYEQGTVYERMAVHPSDLLSMNILIPSLTIQKRIANIINTIDIKISNEQKLLNLYIAQKGYLLKNMFI